MEKLINTEKKALLIKKNVYLLMCESIEITNKLYIEMNKSNPYWNEEGFSLQLA